MNKLKVTAVALTSWLAIGLYSAPASSAMIYATNADFQYVTGEAGIESPRGNNANALGDNMNTFRSLGSGGAGVFSFGSDFSGTVTIWERTGDNSQNPSCTGTGTTCSNWPEAIDVYAGNTWNGDFDSLNPLSGWEFLGELGNAEASGINGGSLQTTGTFKYLLLIDRGLSTKSPIDGFDVVKVGVTAVPLPSAVWLFGSALVGMIGLGRRHSAKNA